MTRSRGKLPLPSLLVIWGVEGLTLAEKVLWIRTYGLDQGGDRGCNASPEQFSKLLGGSIAPQSVETLRQKLKRMGLLSTIGYYQGSRYLSWVCEMPSNCAAYSVRDVPGMAAALGTYLADQSRWREAVRDHRPAESPSHQSGMEVSPSQPGVRAGGSGGLSSTQASYTRISSSVSSSKKGSDSRESELQKKRGNPATRKAGEPESVQDIIDREYRREEIA